MLNKEKAAARRKISKFTDEMDQVKRKADQEVSEFKEEKVKISTELEDSKKQS